MSEPSPMLHLTAVVTREGEWYVARCLEIEAVSQGETVEQALANLREVVEIHLEEEGAPPAAEGRAQRSSGYLGWHAWFTELCERSGKPASAAEPHGTRPFGPGLGMRWRKAAATATRWSAASSARPRQAPRRSGCPGRSPAAAGR